MGKRQLARGGNQMSAGEQVATQRNPSYELWRSACSQPPGGGGYTITNSALICYNLRQAVSGRSVNGSTDGRRQRWYHVVTTLVPHGLLNGRDPFFVAPSEPRLTCTTERQKVALKIGKRRLFSQPPNAPGAATAGLALRVPATVIALGFSAAIHGGLLTASYFVSWNPAPTSNPKINFASGDQTARFQVRLTPWPDPADVDEIKSETHENTKTAESSASVVHPDERTNNKPATASVDTVLDANMLPPPDADTLALSDADSLPAADASPHPKAMVEPLANALESEPVWVIEEVKGLPPVNVAAREIDHSQPVEFAFSELFRRLERFLTEPAPHEDAIAHQPTIQPHPVQTKRKPQASDHKAPLARKGVRPDTKPDAASRNVPARTSADAAHASPPPGKIAQPDSSASRRIGVETGVETLHLPAPKYPSLSRREGEEGLVLLEVEVLPDGTVGTIKLLRSAGFRRLNQAAIAAARKGRFKPATRDGQPIRATVRIPFRFVLRRSDLWYDHPPSLAHTDTSDLGFAL